MLTFRQFEVICMFAVLFQVTLGDDPSTDDPLCMTYSHTTLACGRTCCNGTSILSGLNKNPQVWVDCQNLSSKDGEKSLEAFWRVYTCALHKTMNAGKFTITLVEFAQIVTADYPEGIKKSITDLVNDFISAGASNQSWLTGDTLFTDYQAIDKIRAQYYDIEQKVCEDVVDAKSKITGGKLWPTCSYLTESFHRHADCCGNYAVIPFRYSSKSPAQNFDPANCKNTLQPVLGKIGAEEEESEIALGICRFACYLIEKSFISIDDLLAVRTPSPPLLEGIIKGAMPYLPAGTQKSLAEKSLIDYNGTSVMGDLSDFLSRLADPMNSTKLIDAQEELYGCYAYNSVYETNLISDLNCDE